MVISLSISSFASDAKEVYEWLGQLEGEWTLSTEKEQQGSCTINEEIEDDLDVGAKFTMIGYGTAIQEELMPGTTREMISMYHCKDIACTQLKATHYCIKRNQPQYLLNIKESTESKFVFECDMSTEICASNENHVHKIVHELSDGGNSLRISYLSRKDKKPIPSTVCELER
jgi:hypothetical protein